MKLEKQAPPVHQNTNAQQNQVAKQAISFAEAANMRKEALAGLSHSEMDFSTGMQPQQTATFSQAISPEHRRYYNLTIHQDAEVLLPYKNNLFPAGVKDPKGIGVGNYFMKKGSTLELVGRDEKHPNKVIVRTMEVHYRNAAGQILTAPGAGWSMFYIDTNKTNLNAPKSKIDNQQSAVQDLQVFKDSVLAQQLLNFKIHMREYGERYRKAWNKFQETLKKDAIESQKKEQQLWILVSMITAGSLGWIGEAFGTSAKFAKFLLPGLEDAVQAGFAGEIALASAQPPITDALVSVHPDNLYREIEAKLDLFTDQTNIYVGQIISDVQKSPATTDRVELMLSIFRWYSANVISKTINEKPNWALFQKMIEKNLWASWLIDKETPSYTEYYKMFSGFGTIDYNYGWSHIGGNAQKRLNELGYNWGWEGGIKQAEFFGTDTSKAHSLPTEGKPTEKTITYEGSQSTMRAVKWAKYLQHRYKNNPFQFK